MAIKTISGDIDLATCYDTVVLMQLDGRIHNEVITRTKKTVLHFTDYLVDYKIPIDYYIYENGEKTKVESLVGRGSVIDKFGRKKVLKIYGLIDTDYGVLSSFKEWCDGDFIVSVIAPTEKIQKTFPKIESRL